MTEEKIFHDLVITVYDTNLNRSIGSLYGNFSLIKVRASSLSR